MVVQHVGILYQPETKNILENSLVATSTLTTENSKMREKKKYDRTEIK